MILWLFTLFTYVSIVISDDGFAEKFRPISAIPDEFFTCKQRQPGLYADDKRSCVWYWNCSAEGVEPQHLSCPDSTVFDDRVKDCVQNNQSQTCPIDYGYFESAQSFCRGRPYVNSEQRLEPKAQQYYPILQKNCNSYYWCFNIAGKSYGYEFQCLENEKFDRLTSECKKAEHVNCAISHGVDIV